MKLQFYRKKVNLTQLEVATQLGIKKQTYSGYETENHKPTPEVLVKLANMFGVTVDEILGCAPEQQLFDNARVPKTKVQALYDSLTAHQQDMVMERLRTYNEVNQQHAEKHKSAPPTQYIVIPTAEKQTQYDWE